MPPIVRIARPEDRPAIAEWTVDTFEWGDYVSDAFDDWLADEAGTILVAEVDGAPVAMGRIAMVAPTEAWAQGMRVHPDHRRQGLATTVSTAMWDWARDRGARIVRLAIDERNTPSQAQVTGMGFRRMSDWHRGVRAVGDPPDGMRVPQPERLDDAPSAEAELAYVSWSSGDLARVARGLLAIGWVWRTMTVDHVALAARNHNLLAGRAGWAIAEVDEDTLEVHWLETAPDDAPAMVLALIDRAVEVGAGEINVMIPAVDWLHAACADAGFEFHDIGVWALPL